MKVERYTNWNQTQMMRILDTTCPRCKQHVQFALLDDEFVQQEYDWLQKENTELRKECFRLRKLLSLSLPPHNSHLTQPQPEGDEK